MTCLFKNETVMTLTNRHIARLLSRWSPFLFWRDKSWHQLACRHTARLLPGDERRPSVHHDALLGVNVLLLTRVDNVLLLKALESERPTPVSQQRHLSITSDRPYSQLHTSGCHVLRAEPGWPYERTAFTSFCLLPITRTRDPIISPPERREPKAAYVLPLFLIIY